jgi:hypothetical protein
MPATIFAHQALVLPLKLRWPNRFSGLALCIGSMAPDLEFIFRLSDDWLFSHTLAAQLYFTVPVTLLLVWVVSALLVPGVLPFVQDHPQLRLHALAAIRPPGSSREWARAAMSAGVGGLSHWLLDGVTHGGHSGWAVKYLPWLRTPVPHPGGPAPLHDALQLWLTVLLGIAGAYMFVLITRQGLLWRWRGEPAVRLTPKRRVEGVRLAQGVVVLALTGAASGFTLRSAGTTTVQAAGVAFGALNAVLGGLTLFAWLLLRRRRR